MFPRPTNVVCPPPRLLAAFALALAPAASAASRPGISPNPANSSDETLVLSPFTVTSENDTGYLATNTLAGTRLRTKTKDTASAITILTPQLLDDLGIVDAQEALSFVANTEPYGIQDDDTASFASRQTVKPYRTRGLTASSFSSNFFDTIVPIDRYNTEAFSFLRGPNSILFGTGSAAGILDAQPKRARFASVTSLDTRFDSLGSTRAALELNRQIVPKKLAVQIDALWDDRHTYRKPATEERASLYGTITWNPTDATTVIVNGEGGQFNKVVPWLMMFWDYYTPWVNAGRVIQAASQAASPAAGTRVISANNYYVKIENEDGAALPAMNWRNFKQGNFPTIGGAVRTNVAFASARLSPIPLFTAIEGPGNVHDTDFSSVQAIVEHRFSRNFVMEAGLNRLDMRARDLTTIRANGLGIYVDPNATLPNGQANPYAGLPYVETNPFQFLQHSNSWENQGRISAAYSLDLNRRKLLGGLTWGKYQFGGFLTGTETHAFNDIFQETANVNAFTGLANNAQNFFHRRFYLQPGGQTYLPGTLPPVVQSALAGNAAVPAIHTGFLRTSQGSVGQKSRIHGLSLVMQGSWWNDRMVYTGGWRTDRTRNTRAQTTLGADGIYLPFDPATTPSSTVTYRGQTASHGLTFHLHKALSLFASRSANFVPPSLGRSDFNGDFLPPVSGKGTDAGIRFDLFGGKLNGTLSRYETTEQNRNDSLISKNKQVWVQYLWDAIRGPGFYTAPANPFTDTIDRRSSGYELQLTSSLTEHIRLYGTAAKSRVVGSNVDPIFSRYYDAHLATWQASVARPVNDFRSFGFRTVGDTLTALSQEFAGDLAVAGRAPVNTREWTGSLAATYSLPKNFVKGLRTTARATWRSKPIIGYLLPGPAVTGPLHGRSEATYDLSATYSRRFKIGDRGIDVSMTVQVLNVLGTQKPVPVSAVAYGSGPSDYYVSNQILPAPTVFQYSLRFAF